MQMGLSVVAAAIAADNGVDIKHVVNAAYDTMKRTRFLFIPNSLAYLEKGGRIGRASALLGNVLNIIPILTVINGETSSMTKVRTHKKAVDKMLSILKEDIEELELEKIIVCHINAPEMAKELINEIKKVTNKVAEILILVRS